MGWSNSSADALVLGMLSGCAVTCSGQSLCAGAPGKQGDVVLLQHCWGPVWSQGGSWTWSVVHAGLGLSCPGALLPRGLLSSYKGGPLTCYLSCPLSRQVEGEENRQQFICFNRAKPCAMC